MGDAKGERGFSNARTRCHDDQVARLEAPGHLVKVVEAGGHADHAAGVVLDRTRCGRNIR